MKATLGAADIAQSGRAAGTIFQAHRPFAETFRGGEHAA
jgi:hypothetical protein